jgi:hypothetical protein
MGKKSDLSPECQKFVKRLFAYFSKEKATKKPIVSFDRVYKKASKALGVSYTSVQIGPKCKISSECSLSQNNKKHYNNIFS